LSELSGNLYFDTPTQQLSSSGSVSVELAEGEGLIKEVRRRTEARGLLSKLSCHRCHNAGRKFHREREGCQRRREGEGRRISH